MINSTNKTIYCCKCNKDTQAILISGKEVYPHRSDLFSLPFWQCPNCLNFVGCHHETKNRTNPLGCIANQQIKGVRKHIHTILDPLWQGKKSRRGYLYKLISDEIGYEYHSAEIRCIEEARKIYKFILEIKKDPKKFDLHID